MIEDTFVPSGEDFVKDILTSWGFPNLVDLFRAKGIDFEVFMDLTKENVDQLMPETSVPLGVRWKFWGKYSKFKEETTVQSVIPTQELNTLPSSVEQQVPPVIPVDMASTSISSSVTPQLTEDASLSCGSDYIPHESGDDTDSDITLNLLVEKGKKKRSTIGNQGKGAPPAQKRAVDTCYLASVKGNMCAVMQEVRALDLKKFLASSIEGNSILNTYSTKGYLESDDQGLLADLLIKWLLFRNQRPSKEEYLLLKDKILELFPKEENVYYVAPKENGPNQSLARGKLYDKTRNIKEWMRQKGLLSRVHGEGKAKKKTPGPQEIGPVIELTETIRLSIEWLKTYKEPWTKVTEKWEATSTYRLSEIKRGRSMAATESNNNSGVCGKSLHDYCKIFKVLCQPLGYTLLEVDFTTLFGDKVDNLLKNWPVFSRKIEKLLADKSSLKDPEGKVILESYTSCTNEDERNIIILQLLPSLLPPSRNVLLGCKRMRPSSKESRNYFISRVEIPAEVQPFISKRRNDTFKSYGPTAHVQPYILYVGEKVNKCNALYVCIDNFLYKLDSVLQVLDVCFKAFFALDAEYPPQSDHVWLLIQRALYEITTNDDPNIFKVTSFINKLGVMPSDA